MRARTKIVIIQARMEQTKILVSDDVSESGLAPLRSADFDVTKRVGLSAEELRALMPAFDGLVVRSETKVTVGLLESAGRRVSSGARASAWTTLTWRRRPAAASS